MIVVVLVLLLLLIVLVLVLVAAIALMPLVLISFVVLLPIFQDEAKLERCTMYDLSAKGNNEILTKAMTSMLMQISSQM